MTIIMDSTNLSKSKKMVISLLRNGEHTKKELVKEGEMSWASVVKTINQLTDDGIIYCRGKAPKEHLKRGKDAEIFSLTTNKPLAIGIDIEYQVSRIILTNLAGDIFHLETYKTPQKVDPSVSMNFIESIINDFIDKNDIDLDTIEGIGIGKPGIGFPKSSRVDNNLEARKLADYLGKVYDKLIRIETNTKAYVVFEKWINKLFDFDDFIFTSIRTGVGTGIIYNDELFNGTHGLSGEIGHMKVIQNGLPCRCGNYGCLETVVNQAYLFEQYRVNVLSEKNYPNMIDKNDLYEGLADLFTRAKAGEKDAVSIIDTAGRYIGYCLAHAVSILDISNLIISGHFGPDGDVILEPIREVMEENTLPKVQCSIKYSPFDPLGHVRGAAVLILKDYIMNIPKEGVTSGTEEVAI